jgi:hypothetical protein
MQRAEALARPPVGLLDDAGDDVRMSRKFEVEVGGTALGHPHHVEVRHAPQTPHPRKRGLLLFHAFVAGVPEPIQFLESSFGGVGQNGIGVVFVGVPFVRVFVPTGVFEAGNEF